MKVEFKKLQMKILKGHMKLKPNKAAGPNGFSSEWYKETHITTLLRLA